MNQSTASVKKDKSDVFYKVGTQYEITINPSDKYQYFSDPFRFRAVYTKMNELCHILFRQSTDIILYPEISEPQSSQNEKHLPRIHFHGIIIFTNLNSLAYFLLYHFKKLSNISSIQINNYRPKYWPIYIQKQSVLMQYLCKNNALTYPIKNLAQKKTTNKT